MKLDPAKLPEMPHTWIHRQEQPGTSAWANHSLTLHDFISVVTGEPVFGIGRTEEEAIERIEAQRVHHEPYEPLSRRLARVEKKAALEARRLEAAMATPGDYFMHQRRIDLSATPAQ